ncbi:phosphatidate cytidylyltransferase [Arsenophonus symbiont of Ornithomya chloropus]|uniref:phosphatidate cytidylyltransferase n=1 Tax=Arsenophonus symbiont of Ornithomya chloropus TaxID=634121 RepID=UPI0032B2FF39
MLNFNTRMISAIILIPLVITGIFFLPIDLFGYVIIFIISLTIWEWCQFFGWIKSIKRIIFPIVFCISLLGLQLSFQDLTKLIKEPLIICILYIGLIWWVFATILLITFPLSVRIWSDSLILKMLFCILTILPFYCGSLLLRSINYVIDPFIGSRLILYVILLVWSTDIGGYFFGYFLGKHKLAEKISPSKTFEGMFGGIVTAGFIGFLFNCCVPNLVISKNLLINCIIIFSAILGDLTESMFKRQSGIKNTSNLIPGHGGVLDRIDSLIAATTVFAGLILFFLVL